MKMYGMISKQPQMFFKIGALKSFTNYLKILESLFLIKTPTQVFSCDICLLFENTYFTEHLR